jgi:hypothetical protein
MPTKAEPITTTVEAIESEFELISFRWFGGKWCPAVTRKDDGTYQIRVLMSRITRGADVTDKYDYFELDADGVIVRSPRGYARTYNKLRVRDIADAVARFAAEDPSVPPMRF